MAWTCEHTEERLSDCLERSLAPEEAAAFEAHRRSCARCDALAARVAGMLGVVHVLPPVEPPPRLYYNILDVTLGPRGEKPGWRAALAWMRLLWQPRFAMGMVTVLVTMLTLGQAAGIEPQKLTKEDFYPTNMYREANRRAHLMYSRSVKFVNDLRVVYEIQSRLRPDQRPTPAEEQRSAPKQAPPQHPPAKERNQADENRSNPMLLASATGGESGRRV